MLRIPEISPDEAMLIDLMKLQLQIDAGVDYPSRVAAAKKQWASQRSSAALRDVAQLLTEVCSGGWRCSYCEDSLGTDIEHIWPKSLYPECVFDWMNFLLVCKHCNGRKGASWAVYPATTGTYQVVSRPHKTPPVAPPTAGDPVFIDPRQEDALLFFVLDLRLFRFVVKPGLGGRLIERARYTLNALGLNEDALCTEREHQYGNYLARLKDYLSEKRQGATTPKLDLQRSALLRQRLPTVFREMQRQHARIPELSTLFGNIPEALGW